MMDATAQNIPDGSTLPNPGTAPPGAIGRPGAYDATPSQTPTKFNYSRKYEPLIPMTTIPSFGATKSMPIHVTSTYKDGFGTPLMIINKNGSSRDIISAFDLRQGVDYTASFLSYPDSAHGKFKMDPFTDQASYYLNKYPNEKTTAYTKNKIDIVNGIPVTTSYKPGLQNVGYERGVSTSEHTNDANELMIVAFSAGSICKNGYYNAGELRIGRTVDEHGNETLLYTDKSKRVLCKKVYDNYTSGTTDGYLYTYYLYDDMGKVRYIVPPKAAEQLHNNNCISNISDLCYSFEYDEFGNVIKKYTPGKFGASEFVYDVNYQQVMSRNGNMSSDDEWAFVIFDKRGRPVITGIYTGTESSTYWRDVILGKVSPINRGVPQEETLEYWLQNYFSGNTYPQNLDGCVIHTINYYDSYDNIPLGTVPSFDNSFSGDYLSGPSVTDPKPYNYVNGKLVASQTRILDNGLANNFTNTPWITTVSFYDERGRTIQTHTLNPWNTQDWDVSTTQYNFKNQPVLEILQHYSWTQNTKPSTLIRTKYEYGSKTGRLETVTQKIDAGLWQPLAGYIYDEMGQVKVKWLGNVEEQVYSFDIRGKNTGINADSLMMTSVVSNTKTFFSKLHYDHGYSMPRYDGQISGFQWRVRGSDVMSYGYEYDAVNRMTNAEFRAYNNFGGTTQWNKSNIDFTVSNISYDPNGNMLTMDQRGYDANMNPADIDLLSYTYNNGNQLQKVEDNGVASVNYIKDFDNGTTGSNNDYQYDLNGNLQADANKNITSITYNHLDLPLTVTTPNGTIENIYSSAGELLQKTIVENGNTKIYRYWGPFVYLDDDIDHLLHQEGRARYDGGTQSFTYDFFVKDHLGNVRTVVEGSNSYDKIEYHAGWEIISANIEEGIFDQVGEVRDNKPLSIPSDLMSGKLNGAMPGERIGASILVHTMAGDQFNLSAYGYYETVEDTYDQYATSDAMMSSLTDALTGAAGGGEGDGGSNPVTVINNLLTPTNYALYDNIKNSATNNQYPRAYLNYLVFNESFELQPQYTRVVQLQGGANAWHQMQMPTNMVMPITGYLMVYLSNESTMDVYVDNEYLIHYQSNLLEENHYYPHGLVIDAGNQGVVPKNNYLHQGKKLQPELGLELYDFHARQYDPQIGRFWGIDPADQFPNGYTGMGNDPANMIDPSGMWSNNYGIQSNPKYNGMNDRKALREAFDRFSRKKALASNFDVAVPDLLLSAPTSGPISPAFAEQEMKMNQLLSLYKAQEEIEFKTMVNDDEIGGGEGTAQVPGMAVFVGEDADKIDELYEDLENGYISLEDYLAAASSIQQGGNKHDEPTEYFIIAHDNEGAMRQGHTAALVGNDKKGYLFFSKEGYQQLGDMPISRMRFNNLREFLNDPVSARYERFAWKEVTALQASAIKQTLHLEVTSDFSIGYSNCVRSVERGARAGLLEIGTTIRPNTFWNNLYDNQNENGFKFFYRKNLYTK